MDDKELIEAGKELFKKMGGIGSRDARILSAILQKWIFEKERANNLDLIRLNLSENIQEVIEILGN